jgi:hypothetical protein
MDPNSRYAVLRNQGMSHAQAIAQQEFEVFGANWVAAGRPRDKNGQPIEFGIPLGEAHFAALKRSGGE